MILIQHRAEMANDDPKVGQGNPRLWSFPEDTGPYFSLLMLPT